MVLVRAGRYGVLKVVRLAPHRACGLAWNIGGRATDARPGTAGVHLYVLGRVLGDAAVAAVAHWQQMLYVDHVMHGIAPKQDRRLTNAED